MSQPSRLRRAIKRPQPTTTRRWLQAWKVGLGAIVVLAIGLTVWSLLPVSTTTWRKRAEAAEARKAWRDALVSWRQVNQTPAARSKTWLAEARVCFALDLAAQAENALCHATEADSAESESWHLWLDLLRTEGRLVEAQRVGWEAYASVEPTRKRLILKDLTLALLFFDDAVDSLPDDRSLDRLDRWVKADPNDVAARIALHRRVASLPRPGDPDLASWIVYLSQIVSTKPDDIMAREALIMALSDSGEIDAGRVALIAWPESKRDARYFRLKGRWELEYGGNPAGAISVLETALAEFPQDWRTRVLLSRAFQSLKRPDEARYQAAEVASLRELLDPANLVPRLATDFASADPRVQADMISLCHRAGLDRLADAWRRETAINPTR